jgi:UDP-N-acetylglucosamine--N-acetylmuramyl-(pentapeptide) pyrophosphoryl-undecaprenol N-acetylglucosamine transferase
MENSKIENKTICFVAGRSGGHIKPALTLAHQAKENGPAKIIFISTAHELDKKIIQQSASVDKHIRLALGNIPRNLFFYPWYCYKLFMATLQTFFIFYKEKPSKIISMGGYISLPVCLAAKLRNIPVELYELNATPGKASKMLAPFCNAIKVPFKQARRYFDSKKISWTKYPLTFKHTDKISQKQSLEALNLFPDKKTIVVLGGSQGSLFINHLMKNMAVDSALSKNIQIIHQTGANDPFNWKSFYTELNIPSHVFTYSDSMALYYNAADIIICRAGAGTLFEALFFQKSCIVIPLETKSTAHQVDNALAMKEEYPEWFTVIRQKDLDKKPALLLETLKTCLFKDSLLRRSSK